MPDFDIDFCQERRDEVIRYVQQKYGRDRVAQIITFGKLQARAVLRDVGRVLEMPYGQVDRLCKLVPNNPANPVTLAQAIEGESQLRAAIAEDPAVARLFDIARKLEGLYRHASTHAAGVVIGDRPLEELVPALSRSALRHAGHPVQHEGCRAGGAGEVRLPRPQDPDGADPGGEAGAPARHRRRSDAHAARRSQDLRHAEPRRFDRRVPAGKLGHARRAAQAEARPVRGHHRPRRPLPPGPDGQHPEIHQRQERHGARRLSAPRSGADPEGDLRHHGLPGAGDADRPDPVRLYAGRGRSAAPRHGQEDQGGDGGPAQGFRRWRGRPRRGRGAGGRRSSRRSTSSPATASTNATPRPMR